MDDDDAAARAAWHKRAVHRGLICPICEEPIAFDERAQFEATGMCAYHAARGRRDDR